MILSKIIILPSLLLLFSCFVGAFIINKHTKVIYDDKKARNSAQTLLKLMANNIYNDPKTTPRPPFTQHPKSLPNNNISKVIPSDPMPWSRTMLKLKELINCTDKQYISKTTHKGEYWVLENYIPAEHGPLACYESVTYATLGDLTYLDNIVTVLLRWRAPVSFAVYAHEGAIPATIEHLTFLRKCHQNASLVRQWTSFHLLFPSNFSPVQIPLYTRTKEARYRCETFPTIQYSANEPYSSSNQSLDRWNIARTVAREAAITHFYLASDSQLYPSPNIPTRFLEMLAKEPNILAGKNHRVFIPPIFEIGAKGKLPWSRKQLLNKLKKRTAVLFHDIPNFKEWSKRNESNDMQVFHTSKRMKSFWNWQPIFIGTQDPLFDETVEWEGKKETLPQGFIMCLQSYDFMVLDNAFLVHRQKVSESAEQRDMYAAIANNTTRDAIRDHLRTTYNKRLRCYT